MKILPVIVLTALSAISATAGAVDFDIGVGYTHYGHQPNGVWYQEGFPYKYTLDTPSISLGVKGKIDDTWGWRAGYINLGRAEVHSQVQALDSVYSPTSPTHCNGPCWPLTQVNGSGVVQGLYATANPQFQYWGINWVGEAGLFMYRPSWVVDYPVWYTNPSGPPDTGHYERKLKWQTGVTLGIGFRFKDSFTLMLNRYTCDAKAGAVDDTTQYPAIYHGGATVLSLRYDF
jgi:hypothetical protein